MLGTLNLVKPFCVMLQDNGHLLLQALPSRLSTDCYYLLYLITFSISAFFPCVLTHKLDSSSSDHLLAQIFLPGEPFLWFHVHPCLLWRCPLSRYCFLHFSTNCVEQGSLLPWSVLQNFVVYYSLLWEIL